MHRVYLLLIALSLTQPGQTALVSCPAELNLTALSYNLTCYADRIESAIRRHIPYIIGFGFEPEKIYLACPACPGETLDQFEWKYIPRTVNQPIFQLGPDLDYDSHQILNDRLLTDVPVEDATQQCLIPDSRDLYLAEIEPEKIMGTYVCRHKVNWTHPSNYIWYHLDMTKAQSVLPVDSNSVSSQTTVDKEEQITQLQQLVRKDLLEYPSWSEQTHGWFVMTSRLVEDEYHIKKCGPMEIGQERQCYIQIPLEEPKWFTNRMERIFYQVLRSAFDFLASAPGYTIASGERIRQTVREQIRAIGFDFQGNGSYMYIPCGYTLLPHLYNFTKLFDPFPEPDLRMSVIYDVRCTRINFNELFEFARQSDFTQINSTLPSLIDFRYTKIQRLVIQGERGLRLPCSTTNRRLTCSGPTREAIWRSGNDLTFDDRKKKGQNIYVTDRCELYFEVVKRLDVDIYYCYLREPGSFNRVWSNRPRIAYRLLMERASHFWPQQNDILIGLIVLIIWSLCLSLLWLLLNLYDSVTRDYALFEATVKQAGGRMRRLKKVYSPFSDEDKALFFKVIPRE